MEQGRGYKRKNDEREEECGEFQDCFLEAQSNEMDTNKTTVKQRLTALEKELRGRGGMVDQIEQFEAIVADLTNDYCELKADRDRLTAENSTLKYDMNQLQAIVSRQDKQIEQLKKDHVDQVSRSMRSNVLLHNMKEEPKENPEYVFRKFLAEKTNLSQQEVKDIKFDRVHRVGHPSQGIRIRPIVAKATFYKDRERILQAWRAAASKKQDKTQARITIQLPQEIVEKRAQNFQLLDNMRQAAGGQEKIDFSLKLDKLYVNNTLIKPTVTKPTLQDIFTFDSKDQERARHIPSATSKQLSEQGSIFMARAFTTNNTRDMRLAYTQVLSNPAAASADHNIMVYRVGNEIGWVDDGEHGAGRFLASWLKKANIQEVCFVVSRQYGGKHMGARRFEMIRKAAEGAYSALTNAKSE